MKRIVDWWKKLPRKYRTVIGTAIFLFIVYVLSSFHTENVSIPLVREYTDSTGTREIEFNVLKLDDNFRNHCEPSFNKDYFLRVDNSKLPENFRDFKIYISCIGTSWSENKVSNKAIWNLREIAVSVEYPKDIVSIYSQSTVIRQSENFLIDSSRNLQFRMLNLETGKFYDLVIQFKEFDSKITDCQQDKYGQVTCPQPESIVLQIRWFEFTNVVDFIKEQIGNLSLNIFDHLNK